MTWDCYRPSIPKPTRNGGRPRVWRQIQGKVGGFLGNHKANASLLLQGVKEQLNKDFELRDGIAVDKYVYSRPAADDIIDDLASQCDFVVTCIAD